MLPTAPGAGALLCTQGSSTCPNWLPFRGLGAFPSCWALQLPITTSRQLALLTSPLCFVQPQLAVITPSCHPDPPPPPAPMPLCNCFILLLPLPDHELLEQVFVPTLQVPLGTCPSSRGPQRHLLPLPRTTGQYPAKGSPRERLGG